MWLAQRYALRDMKKLSLLTLPGTFLHELMHYLVALLTNGKPDKFRLSPQKTENGYVLGYVTFVPAWYNAALIGLAPMLLLPLAWLSYLFASDVGFAEKLWLGAFAGACLNGSIPSSVDLNFVVRYPVWLIASILLAVAHFSPGTLGL